MVKKSESSPAYLWYPKDAFSSGRIEELSAAEECWYRRALDRSWIDEGLPSDPAKAAAHIGKKCTASAAAKIIAIFFKPKRRDPSKVVNARQERERASWLAKKRQKSAIGVNAARKRWEQKESADANALPNDAIPIPISIPKEEGEKSVAETASTEPPRLEIHLGKIIAGLMSELGLKTERGIGSKKEWLEAGTIAFENGFTAEEFLECYSILRAIRDYKIRPLYVTENLPDLKKLRSKQNGNQTQLPTVAEKLAEAETRQAPRPVPADFVRRVQGKGQDAGVAVSGGGSAK